jgi:hypothetical protein
LNDILQLLKKPTWLLAIYMLLSAGGIYLAFQQWGYDDPYITFRYARNIAHGLGFVYNPDARILSTTTPFFTLLLAAGALLKIPIPPLANLLGAIGLVAGGICLWDLGKSWKSPQVSWAGLLLYPTFPLLVSTLSSEMPVYLAFCLGAFAFFARQRYTLAAILGGAATLTRPDGILLAGLLLVAYYLFSNRKKNRPISTGGIKPVWLLKQLYDQTPLSGFIVFLALILAWSSFSWFYFGSLLPTTLATKQQQGLMVNSLLFAPGFLEILQSYTAWPYLLELILALAGGILVLRQSRVWFLFLAWTLVYFSAYSLLGVSRYFWYYAPLVPGFITLVGLGLSIPITDFFPPSTHSRSNIWRTITSKQLMVGAIMTVLLGAQITQLAQAREVVDWRLALYRTVGEWLAIHTPKQSTVGTLEVGIIGYYSQRPMVDFAGLIQPEIALELKGEATYEEAASRAIQHYQPNYLILFAGSFPKLTKEILSQGCNVVRTFRYPAIESIPALLIYKCH